MKKIAWLGCALAVMALVAAWSPNVVAQDDEADSKITQKTDSNRARPRAVRGADGDRGARPERGNRGERGGRGNAEEMRARMEQFRERMIDDHQERLDISDAEWKVMRPLLKDVVDKQWEIRATSMGRGGRGGRGGGFGGPQTPEIEALRETVEKKDAPAADIKAKMEAVRAIRKKQQDELKAAQEKLRKVLTLRQEAALVLGGTLD